METRTLRLGSTRKLPKNIVEPQVSVRHDSNIGEGSALGSKLIQEVSQRRGIFDRPAYLIASDELPGRLNVVCRPTMEASDDYIAVKWSEKGRVARLDLNGLLAARQIQIPDGSRMVFSLRAIDDPDFGPSILFQFDGAKVLPIKEAK